MVHKTNIIEARLVVDFSESLQGKGELGPCGVGWDGTILAAAFSQNQVSFLDSENKPSFSTFPTKKNLVDYTVATWKDFHVAEIAISQETVMADYIQPTAEGIFFVDARCKWSANQVDQNGAFYNKDGQLQRRITLGDGINDVWVAPNNQIWASYFDEGVFGNYGWNHPGPAPIGESGLCAFDLNGNRIFEYDAHKAQTQQICDAYALNINLYGEVWVYFYTEFPIVCIRKDGSYTRWHFGQSGAYTLAVCEPYVLFLEYQDKTFFVSMVELTSKGSARVIGKKNLVDSEGNPFLTTQKIRAFGVGKQLFLFVGYKCFVVEDWWPT